VPLSVEHLSLLPSEGLQLPVVVEDTELYGLPDGVETHGELRSPRTVRDSNQLPWGVGGATVAEGGHEAELLGQTLVEYPECGHNEVGHRVYPVSCLHPVGATNPCHARIAVEVDIKLKFTNEVKGLKIVVTRLVVGTGIGDLLNITWSCSCEYLSCSCYISCCCASCCCPCSSWSSCCCRRCRCLCGCCWWPHSCLRQQKAGVVCILVAIHSADSQFSVSLSDPHVCLPGGFKGSVARKKSVVFGAKAGLLLGHAVGHVELLHPHAVTPGAEIEARAGGGLKADRVLAPETLNHPEHVTRNLEPRLTPSPSTGLSLICPEVSRHGLALHLDTPAQPLPPCRGLYRSNRNFSASNVAHDEGSIIPVVVGEDFCQLQSSAVMADEPTGLVYRLKGNKAGEEVIHLCKPGTFLPELLVRDVPFLNPESSLAVPQVSPRFGDTLEADAAIPPEPGADYFEELGLRHEIALYSFIHGPVVARPVLRGHPHNLPPWNFRGNKRLVSSTRPFSSSIFVFSVVVVSSAVVVVRVSIFIVVIIILFQVVVFHLSRPPHPVHGLVILNAAHSSLSPVSSSALLLPWLRRAEGLQQQAEQQQQHPSGCC